jgi:hypothetical protein
MSDYDKEIEEAFEAYWHGTFEGMSADDYIKYKSVGKSGEFNGFKAGAKFQKEKDAERIESVYPVPCACHLFKEQVCDFCQGIVKYIRLKTKDKEASEG